VEHEVLFGEKSLSVVVALLQVARVPSWDGLPKVTGPAILHIGIMRLVAGWSLQVALL
jgi:hypothetical protein